MVKKKKEEEDNTIANLMWSTLKEHGRDKESVDGIMNFFDSLFKPKINFKYRKGERIEYAHRKKDKDGWYLTGETEWWGGFIFDLIGMAEWNNFEPREIIVKLDNGSTRIVDIYSVDKRLRKVGEGQTI